MTETRERDVILAGNEFSYVQDMTKGDIIMYVGPTKFSLSNTERLVQVSPTSRRIVPDNLETGIQSFVFVSSSQYVEVENPTKKQESNYGRGPNQTVELDQGKKVVKAGPATFPLWPGQFAKVVEGHKLKEDHYLLVRAYDKVEGEERQIGEELIVKGTDTRFYIPQTGMEVVKYKEGYVRNAVKLRDAEYCVLLKPDGTKRFVEGPAVVFPEVGEQFYEEKSSKAVQLKKETGLHLYVTKDLEVSKDDKVKKTLADLIGEGKFKVGQELFVEGKEGLFFPSEYLEVKALVSPRCISENEGLYVRDIMSGKIDTVTGPKTFLPDPTKVEIVERGLEERVEKLYGTEGRDRTKAITVNVPTNTAVMVTSKDKRKVLKGPQTYILDFNEELEVLNLSTGKPKNDEKKLATAFLQVDGNKVSDVVSLETKDHVKMQATVSYRVSFTDQPEKWFDVSDYVGLLCDHLSSVVRATVKSTPLEEFYSNSTEIIRASVLGNKVEGGKREGKLFRENGMKVYDLEVLQVEVMDKQVAQLLSDSQKTAIQIEMDKRRNEFNFDFTTDSERIKQETLQLKATTYEKELAVFDKEKQLNEAKLAFEVSSDRDRSVGFAQNKAEASRIMADQENAISNTKLGMKLQELNAEAEAYKAKMEAVSPQLVAAVTRYGDQQLVTAAIKDLGKLSFVEGLPLEKVVKRLLGGLPLLDGVEGVLTGNNGQKEAVTK